MSSIRFAIVAAIAVVLTLSATTITVYAQEAGVKAAVDKLHDALSSLDMKKMEAIWVHDSKVTLINPRDKTPSVGWDAVKKNWENTFGFWSELKPTQVEGPHIRIIGNTAVSVGIAKAQGKPKSGGSVEAPTYETDVFVKKGNQWMLVSHTASRVPQ